jgi:hypothetical protein
LAGLLALTLSLAGAPAASGATWRVEKAQQPLSTVAGAKFDGVSCPSARYCVAVGYHTDSAGFPTTLAERWNGTAWTTQTTRNYQPVDDLLTSVSCVSTTACMAVGEHSACCQDETPLAEFWSRGRWTLELIPLPANAFEPRLTSVSCTSATACTAVGYYLRPADGYTAAALVESWNGTSWHVQSAAAADPTVSRELGSVSCTSLSACTAVGEWDTGSFPILTLAERWDGTSWSVQPTPNPTAGPSVESAFTGVSCASVTDCVTAGFWTDAHTSGPLAEGWDAGTWTLQTMPPNLGPLSGIDCPSVTGCVAVGVDRSSPRALPLAEGWDGTSWTVQSFPVVPNSTSSQLTAVSCTSATACTAVGYAANTQNTATFLLAARYS